MRGNLLSDAVLFDVFKLTMKLTRIAIDVPYSNSQDRVRSVIKEIGSCARFFSFACMSKHFNDQAMRITVLSIIRENLDILFHPALEDIADVGLQASAAGGLFPRRGPGGETGVGTGNSAVLEAVQVLGQGTGNVKKVSVWSMSYVKVDRNRVSQVFWVYLTNACYGLVLEDDSAVRIEATRILAYLSVHRGSLMEQILGNFTVVQAAGPRIWKSTNTETMEETALKAAKEVDIFRDGFSKLVPDAAGNYEIFLRGGTDDNNSEDNRFADFSFWISDNSVKCDKTFFGIDSALQWLLPAALEIEEVRRQLEYVSATHSTNGLSMIQNSAKGREHQDAVKNAAAATLQLERAAVGSKHGDQVSYMLERFDTFGLLFLASGATAWGTAWNAVQSGPIWGYLPIRQLRRDRSQEDAPSIDSRDRYYGIEDEESSDSFRKAWYLNFTEGPERVRRKLEQDYSVPLPLTRGQKREVAARKALRSAEDRTASSSSLSSRPDSATRDQLSTPVDSSSIVTAVNGGDRNSDTDTGTGSNSAQSADSTPGATADDMADFLKKISKEGLIKRVGAGAGAGDVYFEKDDAEEEAYLALQSAAEAVAASGKGGRSSITGVMSGGAGGGVGMEDLERSPGSEKSSSSKRNELLVMEEIDTGDGDGDRSAFLSMSMKELTASGDHMDNSGGGNGRRRGGSGGGGGGGGTQDDDEPLSPEDDDFSRPNSPNSNINEDSLYINIKQQEVEDRRSGERAAESNRLRRSHMLAEIVKGVIGPSEWAKGTVYNVKR